MIISGHATRAVFDDYTVALANEQRAAPKRVTSHVASQRRRSQKVVSLRSSRRR